MSLILPYWLVSPFRVGTSEDSIHASRTPGDLAALLHAVELAAAVGLGLAHHVVIIVVLASRANKERSAEEGRRTGSELFDLGDVVGQRGCVDEGLLVEPGAQLAGGAGGGVGRAKVPGLTRRHVEPEVPMAGWCAEAGRHYETCKSVLAISAVAALVRACS
jgi:hypothetical protein